MRCEVWSGMWSEPVKMWVVKCETHQVSFWQAGISWWLCKDLRVACLIPFLTVNNSFQTVKDFWKDSLCTGKTQAKEHRCTTGRQVNNNAFEFVPGNLPPQQYAKSPFNSIAFLFTHKKDKPPESHKNVHRPMSILLHKPMKILQKASSRTYTKRETNTVKNSGDKVTTIKTT